MIQDKSQLKLHTATIFAHLMHPKNCAARSTEKFPIFTGGEFSFLQFQ
jgi:hypothetical protein